MDDNNSADLINDNKSQNDLKHLMQNFQSSKVAS